MKLGLKFQVVKMAAALLDSLEDEIRQRVCRGDTLQSVSQYLQRCFPSVIGLSTRSVRRFCRERNIRYRSNLSDEEVDRLVSRCVFSIGHTYGRRSLHGLLRSEGVHVSQRRLGRSLQRTFPAAHSRRHQTAGRSINPIPYRATFYGQKLHMDQNEKLVMYGVVHVVAVDGFSRKIVGFSTMPRKNAITIYNTIMRPLLLSEGIWDQLRSDYGTEFALVATVQEQLAQLRVHQQCQPALQTTSRQNHRAERVWPEINSRVNYPVKAVLISMENEEVIDMQNPLHKFSVSWVTIHVVASPIQSFIRAWNCHRIPGQAGGIPNSLAQLTTQISALHPSNVPSVSDAVNLHESNRSRLTRESTFGLDPLQGYPHLQRLRERDFHSVYPSMELLFSDILHNQGTSFKEAILLFISLSLCFSELLPS